MADERRVLLSTAAWKPSAELWKKRTSTGGHRFARPGPRCQPHERASRGAVGGSAEAAQFVGAWTRTCSSSYSYGWCLPGAPPGTNSYTATLCSSNSPRSTRSTQSGPASKSADRAGMVRRLTQTPLGSSRWSSLAGARHSKVVTHKLPSESARTPSDAKELAYAEHDLSGGRIFQAAHRVAKARVHLGRNGERHYPLIGATG